MLPLHKRRTKADANNYRGIHLTSQVSKVTESLFSRLLQRFCESADVFGENQFAYTRGRGAKDALGILMLRLLSCFDKGDRVGLYCSDVSGAFDRVNPVRLCNKLASKGMHPQMLAVFRSWLGSRVAQVIVDGAQSDPYPLENSVFQGTVLGPPLWNCYFEDARRATQAHGFCETIFADDLNCLKPFAMSVSVEHVCQNLASCQGSLHNWGSANQVVFDSSKESFHILHPRRPWGNDVKLLGVTIDTRLVMDKACYEIAARASLMVKRILRCRHMFSIDIVLALYKTHVLSFIEYYTAAVHHSPKFFLSAVDAVHDNFLSELRLSAEDALLEHNLAPLCARRDIAMLGLLHKVVLNKAPPQFSEYIFLELSRNNPRGWRNAKQRRNKQLHDPIDGTRSKATQRSVLGLVYTYNMLPQAVVDAKNVHLFQRKLQNSLKKLASHHVSEWPSFFNAGVRTFSPEQFHSWFV